MKKPLEKRLGSLGSLGVSCGWKAYIGNQRVCYLMVAEHNHEQCKYQGPPLCVYNRPPIPPKRKPELSSYYMCTKKDKCWWKGRKK